MLALLHHPVFRRLYAAQLIALAGTGLLTVALGLLAYDLAGGRAGAVLGTAYAIKMVAYVGLSPVAAALVAKMPRRAVLISADLIRAGVALALPFVDAVWQIYVLVFVLQAASATFTPTFQAVIPDVLPDEEDYTRALSLSRLAYDLENLASPALAALLLTMMSYSMLFLGTVAGFAASAILVRTVALPPQGTPRTMRPFSERLTRGIRIYLATPRLRGLLALNLAAASTGAFVLVNTVVLVRDGFGASEAQVAVAMAAFGAGSIVAALALPRILGHLRDRTVMQRAGWALAISTLALALGMQMGGLPEWPWFLAIWCGIGLLYSAILTPSGRLLHRSTHKEDRPAIFAAQFALSHACWLVTYPVAGLLGSAWGLAPTLGILGVLATIGALTAWRVWPKDTSAPLPHDHPDMPETHPHLRAYPGHGHHHTHPVVIDDEHHDWPSHG